MDVLPRLLQVHFGIVDTLSDLTLQLSACLREGIVVVSDEDVDVDVNVGVVICSQNPPLLVLLPIGPWGNTSQSSDVAHMFCCQPLRMFVE